MSLRRCRGRSPSLMFRMPAIEMVGRGWGVGLASEQRRRLVLTFYLILVASILAMDRLTAPASEPVKDQLIFISNADSIDAGRQSNSVYRIGLDGRGSKRLVGSIPHGEGYLRITDIDCEPGSQQLVIASHRQDLNGFHHAMLDGSGLHLDQPAEGDLLAGTRQIALASDGVNIIVSRQFEEFAEPRFGLVRGDLFARHFDIFRAPTAERSYISPDFSPTGRQLAYVIRRHHNDSGWTSRLIIANSAGRKESVTYETRRQISDVAWSPTGEWLALVVDRQIYRMHPFGGAALTQLTDHLGGADVPRWSPDGARISYVSPSTFAGQNQLFVMNTDGSGKRRVANILGEVVNGCWV